MTTEENFDRLEEIVLSTGDVDRKYIVRDIIFCGTETSTNLFAPETDLNAILAPLKNDLKQQALSYGADAVINCHFDYHRHQDKIDVLAYGTVVQFIQSTIG